MQISRLGVVANLVTVVAAFVTAYFWMESRFQDTLDKRVEPYEQLLQGLSLSQYGNSEKAIEMLSKAFRSLSTEDVSEATLAAVIDPYLSALADSDNPAEHWPDFQQLLPYINKRVPLNGERLMHMAWIYLYTGHLEEAQQKFSHSIRLYGGDQDSTPSAESHLGLTLTFLSQNEANSALSEFLKAEEKDPFNHNVDDAVKGKEWFFDQWSTRQLAEIYAPNFSPAVEEMYISLLEVQRQRNANKAN